MSDIQELRRLQDRFAIIDAINRYGTATDTRDWNGLRSCFVEEPLLDFSAFESSTPQEPKPMKADAFVEFARKTQNGLTTTQHLIGNHAITLLENEADCSAHFVAWHYLSNRRGSSFQVQGGWYEMRLTRMSDGWRISRLVLHVLWNDGNWGVFESAQKTSQNLGEIR